MFSNIVVFILGLKHCLNEMRIWLEFHSARYFPWYLNRFSGKSIYIKIHFLDSCVISHLLVDQHKCEILTHLG